MAFAPTSNEPSVSVEEHLERVLEGIHPLAPYEQLLLDALGLPVGEPVVAGIDLPAFDNSAMDGYAVHVADLEGAGPDTPVALPVVGEAAAGRTTLFALPPGTAAKIMTGAPVPAGADAVVPVEWTDAGAATVRISGVPAVGQHVRRQGEDVRAGDQVLEEGQLLGPRQLGLLAGIGRGQVQARPRPRVVVLSTGAELRDPGQRLSPDAIYDANSYMLAAAVRAAGAVAYRVGIVPDDPQVFADTLSDQLVRADLVVTSGGVSKGEYDVVKEVLSELGTVWFGEVRMQPGKPQGFGHVGEDRTPIFALPGNPVSSFVSFELFVLPALRRMTARLPYRRPTTQARLTGTLRSAPGKAQYARARYEVGYDGPTVSVVGGHGSHLLGDLAAANALVAVPADATVLEAGATVQVLVLDRDF